MELSEINLVLSMLILHNFGNCFLLFLFLFSRWTDFWSKYICCLSVCLMFFRFPFITDCTFNSIFSPFSWFIFYVWTQAKLGTQKEKLSFHKINIVLLFFLFPFSLALFFIYPFFCLSSHRPFCFYLFVLFCCALKNCKIKIFQSAVNRKYFKSYERRK